MITNFKIFENITLKYKPNDYVYVVGYLNIEGPCKILMVNGKINNRSWDYMIETYNNLYFYKAYIDESDIKRKLTLDEIDEYEAKKDAIKYNI